MKEPIWIEESDALAFQAQQISLFGGIHGVRDRGLLQSALARARNVWAYESEPRLSRLAAAYAFGISSNHPFLDGNKRCALMVSFIFVEINGRDVAASQEEAALTFLQLAAGELTEEQLAEWFEQHTAARP